MLGSSEPSAPCSTTLRGACAVPEKRGERVASSGYHACFRSPGDSGAEISSHRQRSYTWRRGSGYDQNKVTEDRLEIRDSKFEMKMIRNSRFEMKTIREPEGPEVMSNFESRISNLESSDQPGQRFGVGLACRKNPGLEEIAIVTGRDARSSFRKKRRMMPGHQPQTHLPLRSQTPPCFTSGFALGFRFLPQWRAFDQIE